MIPANNKIIVSVDFRQKERISVLGNDLMLGKHYSNNRRESMPVVCKVENGGGHIKDGTFLVVHHNRFTENSPHHLAENIYSLAYNSSIFVKLDSTGKAKSICDNIIVEYIYEDSIVPVPAHLRKPNPYKYIVSSNGFGFKKGQIVFAYEFANYEIVYVFAGVEHKVVKIAKNDIVGKLVK